MKTNLNKTQKGFTLVELLIYAAGLLVIGSIIVVLLVQFYAIYREMVAAPRADRTALLIVDRITKEIRSADHINLVQSQFQNINGVLTLETYQDNQPITKKFFVEEGVAYYEEDGETDPISSKDLTISNFSFEYLPTPVSESVRFVMEIQYQVNNATETKSYTGFTILRESYE